MSSSSKATPPRQPIAFLGAGNMAAAMIDGLLAQGTWPASDIRCLGGGGKTAAALAARTGITLADSLESLLAGAGAVVIAFKPQHLASVDLRLAELTAGKFVISVLAGKRLTTLAAAFPSARNLARFMPNTPARIRAGMTGWCAARPLAPEDLVVATSLLAAMGKAVEVPEAQMDALTAVSGSGPAYVFEFAAALRDAGVAAGLAPETARTLAVETLLGSARLLAVNGAAGSGAAGTPADPEALRNQVTSPNGTTAAGLRRLAEGGFRGLIRDTVLAAKARSEELAQSGPSTSEAASLQPQSASPSLSDPKNL
jgi:pyrroline-5-carboxylate reductase